MRWILVFICGLSAALGAAARGLPARFEAAEGRDHDSILTWPETSQRVAELVRMLTR